MHHDLEQLARRADRSPAAVSLARAASDPDERVREWAVAALEEVVPQPGALDALESLVPSDDPETAYPAHPPESQPSAPPQKAQNEVDTA